jgi:hypothetical protein
MAVPEPCLTDVRAHAARLAPDDVALLVRQCRSSAPLQATA